MMLKQRLHLFVKGIVQGVGFRPYIHRLALKHGLAGWALNASDGVHIEVEGEANALEAFMNDLIPYAPPLAVIDDVTVTEIPPNGDEKFEIRHSVEKEGEFVLVSPDIATCKDCLRELLNPSDRRYRYPFINCTNCGPRFTIIQDLPYDRPKTTMRKFIMCPDCQREYEDISDRRYHAQPNACPKCGPKVWMEEWKGNWGIELGQGETALKMAAKLLSEGEIIAIKGLGGFHLACDACNEEAVLRLRALKGREEKPLAIMSANLKLIERYSFVSEEERHLLESPQKPIVLLRKKEPCPIAPSVAPRNRYLGVMLPYTPLHALLLDEFKGLALVMTSGNISEEPLCKDNDEAKRRLGGIARYFLLHDRDIHMRCDDSVVRCIPSPTPSSPTLSHPHTPILQHPHPPTLFLRRSRGYAPFPIRLDFKLREVLAVGAELKNTFCFTRDRYCFLSQHIGDLKNAETLAYFEESISHFQKLFRIHPEAIAHDLHPDYLSTKWAMSQPGIEKVAVQHHHAHVASCMAEHGIVEPVIGVACDGIGLGTDGAIWGCEFMVATYSDFERKAHLAYVPMPGGDAATKEPWRMAATYLYLALGDGFVERPIPFCRRLDRRAWRFIKQMIDRKVNTPPTSSCGRLFDAVSSLLGLRDRVSFEGQAAMELEQLASEEGGLGRYGFEFICSGGVKQISVLPMFEQIVDELMRGVPEPIIARKFHNTVADFMVEACRFIAEETGLRKVVLSGGTFQNVLLLRLLLSRLHELGLEVFCHNRVPPNDGGIALGQAMVANARLGEHNCKGMTTLEGNGG